MSDTPKPFYLTTPIYYVNARPHIGHAYTTIVGDVLARRHRLLGEETFFLTGTDEHGQKIERSAAAAGIPPQQFTDQVSKTFSDLFARMGITNDKFIRTTSPEHKRGAQALFSKLYENGHIYLDSYTGSYCVSDEAFVDAPVGTPCPDCGKLLEEVTEENFFFKLSEFQLPLLNLIESGKLAITPESAKNEVLSFVRGKIVDAPGIKLDIAAKSAAEQVKIYAEANMPGSRIRFSAQGEPYVPGALRDLSVSRSSFTWGIPVPEPAASASKQPHVIYVWLDALANYITALGYGSEDTTLFDKFWPADLHLVGKEITRFHCVYWPAFLMAAGIATPKAITANGWLLFDNAKMSKSKGNVVRTETILEGFGSLCPPPTPGSSLPSTPALLGRGFSPAIPSAGETGALAPEGVPTQPTRADRDLFATDVLRYFLLREIPFGQDGSFSFEAMITRYNADLANGYGNLVSRTLNMVNLYLDGNTPKLTEEAAEKYLAHSGIFNHASDLAGGPEPFEKVFDANSFALSLILLQNLVGKTDELITQKAPWKLAKSPESRSELIDVLALALASIRIITALFYPILPYTTAKVWQQLGLGDIELAARNGELKNLQWGGLKPGTKLGPLSPIFPRADKGLAQTMADLEEKLVTGNSKPETDSQNPQVPSTTSPAAGPRTASIAEPLTTLPVAGSTALTTGPNDTPSHTEVAASGIFAGQPPAASTESPQITIDDFARIELRVAEIKVAERIPKADKLLRLEVDLGPHGQRQILSGIAEFYTPEELIGRRIVVITNLAPRKMRGLESHGMLLAASEGDHGKPHLATCGPEIALGSRLK